jgi:hypothetical protein
MDPSTPAERLGALQALCPGLSDKELDRLSGRPEGQASLIKARNQRSLRPDVADAYATTLGTSAAVILLGGPLPAAKAVQAAVTRRRLARTPEASTGTEG